MDPITVLSAISATLGIVDKFTDVVKKWRGKEISQHTIQTKQEGEYLQIWHDGHISENIHVSNLIMSEWDDKRYETLKRKIDHHWSIFNDIDADMPMAASDEKARLKRKLDSIRKELCKDFRELIDLHERTLGVPLGDHYSLYNVCADFN